MHRQYAEIFHRAADFRVKYRFYTTEEGARAYLPSQGIRSDFYYEHPDHKVKDNFIIWPEFENEWGSVILDTTSFVPREGTARMWIINEKMRSYHKEKIEVGTRGWFREGNRSTGECVVIELLSLNS